MLDAPADRIALATAQLDAVAAAYARATEIVRPLMGDIPDGHIAVGAMDGWTAVIPKPGFPPADGLELRGDSIATDAADQSHGAACGQPGAV
ncbi:hypothetical protein ACIU1J_19565 [Azospirillum doebereinerae]|uniref:hypothetical protein n=1 Tax=Azospirillum doebereinerae TaxID=92933 RepID=UPI001EE5BCDC|nr:hypothetical protein [Azospirillum doebereinerae]MCG5241879.1 hypothetical protein [Azospirillum doebereinerae]